MVERGTRGGGGRVGPTSEADGNSADGDAILSIVDTATIGKYMDVGAFGSEFAVALYDQTKGETG